MEAEGIYGKTAKLIANVRRAGISGISGLASVHKDKLILLDAL